MSLLKMHWIAIAMFLSNPTSLAKTITHERLKASSSSAKGKRKIANILTQTPASATLQKYFECQDQLPDNSQVVACVKLLMNPEGDKNRVHRLATWLFMRPQIQTIRECSTQEQNFAQAFPEATPHMICFEFVLGKHSKTATMFLEQTETGLYLHSLFY